MSDRKRWEYETFGSFVGCCGAPVVEAYGVEVLNKVGAQGWELVEFVSDGDGNGGLEALMRREVQS